MPYHKVTKERHTELILDGYSIDFISGISTHKVFGGKEMLHSFNDIPSYVDYYADGSVCNEIWHLDNQVHRLNKPAHIEYYKNGQVECYRYIHKGLLHNPNGPAIICYTSTGGVSSMDYYFNGVKCPNVVECAYLNIPYLKPKDWLAREIFIKENLEIYR